MSGSGFVLPSAPLVSAPQPGAPPEATTPENGSEPPTTRAAQGPTDKVVPKGGDPSKPADTATGGKTGLAKALSPEGKDDAGSSAGVTAGQIATQEDVAGAEMRPLPANSAEFKAAKAGQEGMAEGSMDTPEPGSQASKDTGKKLGQLAATVAGGPTAQGSRVQVRAGAQEPVDGSFSAELHEASEGKEPRPMGRLVLVPKKAPNGEPNRSPGFHFTPAGSDEGTPRKSFSLGKEGNFGTALKAIFDGKPPSTAKKGAGTARNTTSDSKSASGGVTKRAAAKTASSTPGGGRPTAVPGRGALPAQSASRSGASMRGGAAGVRKKEPTKRPLPGGTAGKSFEEIQELFSSFVHPVLYDPEAVPEDQAEAVQERLTDLIREPKVQEAMSRGVATLAAPSDPIGEPVCRSDGSLSWELTLKTTDEGGEPQEVRGELAFVPLQIDKPGVGGWYAVIEGAMERMSPEMRGLGWEVPSREAIAEAFSELSPERPDASESQQ